MRFEWDEAKRQANLEKHGVDLLVGALIFEGSTVEAPDLRQDHGEDRMMPLVWRMARFTSSSTSGAAMPSASSRHAKEDVVTDAGLKTLSLDEIRAMMDAGKLVVRPDAPEAELEDSAEFWTRAKVVAPAPKKSVHLRLDPEVFDFFLAQSKGKGHIKKMQAVLAAYMRAHSAAE